MNGAERKELDELAARLGVTRNKRTIVPCSGCGIACHPVETLCCFCVKCVAEQRLGTRRPGKESTVAELMARLDTAQAPTKAKP
jgi:hypothetical protein